MNTPAQPALEPGRAYRTRDLRPFSANPTRRARRLVDEGRLREAAHGLYNFYDGFTPRALSASTTFTVPSTATPSSSEVISRPMEPL